MPPRSTSRDSQNRDRSRSSSRHRRGPTSLQAVISQTQRLASPVNDQMLNINNARADPYLSSQIASAVGLVADYGGMLLYPAQAQDIRNAIAGAFTGKTTWTQTALVKLEPAISFRLNADMQTSYFRNAASGLSHRFTVQQNTGVLNILISNILSSPYLTRDAKIEMLREVRKIVEGLDITQHHRMALTLFLVAAIARAAGQ